MTSVSFRSCVTVTKTEITLNRNAQWEDFLWQLLTETEQKLQMTSFSVYLAGLQVSGTRFRQQRHSDFNILCSFLRTKINNTLSKDIHQMDIRLWILFTLILILGCCKSLLAFLSAILLPYTDNSVIVCQLVHFRMDEIFSFISNIWV